MSLLNDADVLVTGGAGGVRSTLITQLLEAGVGHVDALGGGAHGRKEDLSDVLATGRVTLVQGDVRDRDVVHHVTCGKDLVFHHVLDGGTSNVIEAAAEHGVGKLVAASSVSAYGLAEELRGFSAASGLDYVMLRYFNAYGPSMDGQGLCGEVLLPWMERITAGLRPLVLGDDHQAIDLAFTTDIARANVLAARSTVTEGVYHVASGHETTLLQIAGTLLRVMGSPLTVELGPEGTVAGVVHGTADTSAAAVDLGFVAQVGLEQGLHRLVDWWRQLHAEQASDSPGARAVDQLRSARA